MGKDRIRDLQFLSKLSQCEIPSAENLADPFKSPLEKPAILQKLLGRTGDIADSLNSIVTGKVSPF